MYRNLYNHNFFVARSNGTTPAPDLERVITTPAAQQ
jgi:hypothetical protein